MSTVAQIVNKSFTWITKVHHRVHKIRTLDCTKNQINPNNILISCLFYVHCCIILSPKARCLSSGPFSSTTPKNKCLSISHFPHAYDHHTFLHLTLLIIIFRSHKIHHSIFNIYINIIVNI
jgi:hypothetical protein